MAHFVAEGEQFIVLEAQSLLGDIAEARHDLVGAAACYADIVERSAQHHPAAYHGYFTLRLAGLRARLGADQAADELYRAVPEVTRSVLIATAALVGRGAVARRAARRASTEGDRSRCLGAAEVFYERARHDYAASGPSRR